MRKFAVILLLIGLPAVAEIATPCKLALRNEATGKLIRLAGIIYKGAKQSRSEVFSDGVVYTVLLQAVKYTPSGVSKQGPPPARYGVKIKISDPSQILINLAPEGGLGGMWGHPLDEEFEHEGKTTNYSYAIECKKN